VMRNHVILKLSYLRHSRKQSDSFATKMFRGREDWVQLWILWICISPHQNCHFIRHHNNFLPCITLSLLAV
jgi:hypothetical protein